MKTIKTLLIGIMMMVSTSIVAQPMSYNAMRNNARFLTDRMAYTLGISSYDMLDDLYRINYDYICAINDYLDDIALGYRYDDYMSVCYERDYALQMLLGDALWNRVIGYDYFYRPIIFENHRWRFGIYAYDWDRGHFFFGAPSFFDGYRGGHFFGPMGPHNGWGNWGPGAARWGCSGNVIPGRRGDGGSFGNGNMGGRGNMNGGMNRGGGNSYRGGMNRGGGNSYNGGMNRGSGNSYSGGMNRGSGSSYSGGSNTGNMNRGNTNSGQGNYSGGSRSQGNSQSSSRGGSYSGGQSRMGSSSYGGSRSSSYNGGSSYSGGSRSGSSYSGGSRGSSYSGGNMGGGSRSAGSMSGGSRGGSMGGGSRGGGNMGGGRR